MCFLARLRVQRLAVHVSFGSDIKTQSPIGEEVPSEGYRLRL